MKTVATIFGIMLGAFIVIYGIVLLGMNLSKNKEDSNVTKVGNITLNKEEQEFNENNKTVSNYMLNVENENMTKKELAYFQSFTDELEKNDIPYDKISDTVLLLERVYAKELLELKKGTYILNGKKQDLEEIKKERVPTLVSLIPYFNDFNEFNVEQLQYYRLHVLYTYLDSLVKDVNLTNSDIVSAMYLIEGMQPTNSDEKLDHFAAKLTQIKKLKELLPKEFEPNKEEKANKNPIEDTWYTYVTYTVPTEEYSKIQDKDKYMNDIVNKINPSEFETILYENILAYLKVKEINLDNVRIENTFKPLEKMNKVSDTLYVSENPYEIKFSIQLNKVKLSEEEQTLRRDWQTFYNLFAEPLELLEKIVKVDSTLKISKETISFLEKEKNYEKDYFQFKYFLDMLQDGVSEKEFMQEEQGMYTDGTSIKFE